MISPQQGESYYAQENSYSPQKSVLKDTAPHMANSQWMGKGAAKLGLNGQVKSADFENLLYGLLPDGTNFRHKSKERAGYKERAGLDCTLSAPKSVSVLALVGEKKEIEKAHRQAVVETLKIIEKDYATTRVTRDEKVRRVNTNNLVVGQFHHDTSRENDPHLHTHCVILNLTEHNNKWYSLRNDDIFANRKLLGTIYQNQLALKIKELGYDIEAKKHGQFEIKGFNIEQLQRFSKRREQMLSRIKEQSTWREREKVWDKTRSPKGKAIPRKELQLAWREELGDINYPKPNRNREPDLPKTEDLSVAVDNAIAQCGNVAIAFKPEAVQKIVFSEVGKYSYQSVKRAIASNNELIYLDNQVTTQTALLTELATIKLLKESQNKCNPIASQEETKSFTLGLKKEQKNAIGFATALGAIATLATSRDRIVGWQSKEGVLKTYTLNEFKKLAKDRGYELKGFADSPETAEELSENLEIKTSTIAEKLVSQSQQPPKQQIWIVDEAELLGAKTTLSLLQQAKQEDAKVLLIADPEQLSLLKTGNPFKSLEQAGMATAYLNQSKERKAADLEQAVDYLSVGKAAEGIEILEKHQRLTELPELSTRSSRIARDYLNLSHLDRQKTLIIAGTHHQRQLITDSIRQGLKREGSLGEEVEAKLLRAKNLTSVQKQYAHHYQVGDYVITSTNYKRLGLEKNQQYQVAAVEKDSVTLVGQDNMAKKVNPKWFKHKDIYKSETFSIAVGDQLRWGKNEKQFNRVNSAKFVVTDIQEKTATIKTAKGKEAKINLEHAQLIDHALVSTFDSSQRAIADRVLVSLDKTNTDNLNVAASHAKYDLHLYVEDRAGLKQKANSSQLQANPLELITQHSATTQTFNYERSAAAKPNHKRSNSEQSQSNGETLRKHRIEPDRLDQFAEHVNGFVNEQETQCLERSFRKLEQQLGDRIRPISGAASLRDSINRLDRTLTEYNQQRERVRKLDSIEQLQETIDQYQEQKNHQQLTTRLNDVAESISDLTEEIELEPLADRFAQLNNRFENVNQSDRQDKLEQLRGTIDQHYERSHERQLTTRLNDIAESISDLTEEIELEPLSDRFAQLSDRLEGVSQSDRQDKLEQLRGTIDQYQEQKNHQQLTTQLNHVAESISDLTEEIELEPLADRFAQLNDCLEDVNQSHQLGQLEQLRVTIDQYHERSQLWQQLITRLNDVAKSISDLTEEQELEPLADRFAQLNDKLRFPSVRLESVNQSDRLDKLEQLRGTIDQYQELGQGQKTKLERANYFKNQASKQIHPQIGKNFNLNLDNRTSSQLKSEKLKQRFLEVKQKLAKNTSTDSTELGLKPSKPNFPLPELSPLQLRSRQNYLDAKQIVLKSDSSTQHVPKESEAYQFAFDVIVAKSLKSQSWSTDDITATLSQSDYAHELFQKSKNDHYRHRIAKYIYSVGKKAGLTFEPHLAQNQLPHKPKKSQPEIEL